jgi:outer membrane lipoprotein-sorting protein
MRPAEKVEKLIKKLQYKASAETHDKVLNNVMQAVDKYEKQKTGARVPDIRSTIMKHPIIKLAAAAAIIIVIIAGVSQFGGNGANLVYAGVVEQLASARTMTYSILTQTPVENMPNLRLEMAFKEPGYMRTTTVDGYINIIDWSQNRGISIWPTERQYIDFKVSNLQHDPENNSFMVVEKLRTLPYQADEVLGEKEIDGRVLQGFCVTKADMINTVWIDPVTEQLVRVEIKYANAPGMNTIMTDFQFNVELDDSMFSLSPPADFTRMEVQADAKTITEQDLLEYLHMWSTWTKDSTFPPTFNPLELPKITAEMIKQGKFGEDRAQQQEHNDEALRMYRGIMFVTQLPAESNWRYAGENVQFGNATAPIFWYRPVGSRMYRVIYGDLHIEEKAPEELPD